MNAINESLKIMQQSVDKAAPKETKLQLAMKLIEKYNALIELYWPHLYVKSTIKRKAISDLEAEISSLKIQIDSLT